MNLKLTFLLVFSSFMYLTACNSGIEDRSTAPPNPDEIRTATKEARETFIADYKSTLAIKNAATRTDLAIPTQTPRPIPTYGPAPTTTPPPLTGNPRKYAAITPTVGSLIDLQAAANRYSSGSSEFIQYNPYQLQDMINFLFRIYYPGGYPDPDIVFTLEHDRFPSTKTTYADAVIHYLIANKIDLVPDKLIRTPYFTAKLSPIELDPSNPTEWLLNYEITIEYVFETGWIALKQTPDGKIERLASPNPVSVNTVNTRNTYTHLQDVTGDGIPDFLVEYSYLLLGSHGYTIKYLSVYQGTSEGFHLVSEHEYEYGGYKFADRISYEFLESENPRLEISDQQFPNGSINWDCNWVINYTLTWRGGVERVKTTGDQIPDDPGCLVAQAESLMYEMKVNEIISLLEQAVRLMAHTPPVHPDLEVLARYKLAVLYAATGRQTLAQSHLEGIINLGSNPEAEAALYLSPYLEEMAAKGHVPALELCNLVATALETGERVSGYWGSYISDVGFVWSWEICRPGRILEIALQELIDRYGELPEVQLESLGITLLAKYTGNNNPPDSTSIFLLSSDRPFLVTYNPSSSDLPLEIHYPYSSLPKGEIYWSEINIPGETVPFFVYAYSSYSYGYCPEISLSVGYATMSSTEKLLVDLYVDCLESIKGFNIDTYIEEKYSSNPIDFMETNQGECENLYPNWFAGDPTVEAYEKNLGMPIGDSIYGFNQAFIQSEDPTSLRPLLLHMRDLVILDDPQGPYIYQHLTFLIGVTYLLEEDPCQAAPWLLEVWQWEPVTLWNNLAAAHLALPEGGVAPSTSCP